MDSMKDTFNEKTFRKHGEMLVINSVWHRKHQSDDTVTLLGVHIRVTTGSLQ